MAATQTFRALQASTNASPEIERLCSGLGNAARQIRDAEHRIHFSMAAGQTVSPLAIDAARRAAGAVLVTLSEFERAAAEAG